MQHWEKFSLFAIIRVMSEVRIVLLQDAWCTDHMRCARVYFLY
jgi:hypothetical protein